MKRGIPFIAILLLMAGFAGTACGQRGGWRQNANTSPYDTPWLPKDDQERQLMTALEAMREGRRYANVPTVDGRLLRLLTESMNAQRVVEIGTSTGESALWFAVALRRTGGHLYTHEIDPRNIATARQNFEMAGIDDIVTIIEGDAHETVQQHEDPIDILFLDADKDGYLDYLDQLLPLVRPGGLIIAHNMTPRMADPRYVEAITQNPVLETAFLMMEGSGVSVTMKKR